MLQRRRRRPRVPIYIAPLVGKQQRYVTNMTFTRRRTPDTIDKRYGYNIMANQRCIMWRWVSLASSLRSICARGLLRGSAQRLSGYIVARTNIKQYMIYLSFLSDGWLEFMRESPMQTSPTTINCTKPNVCVEFWHWCGDGAQLRA